MGPVEKVLRATWKLIENVDNRCAYHSAVDKLGNQTYSNSGTACKWCSSGALEKILIETESSEDVYNKSHRYLSEAVWHLDPGQEGFISRYNDRDYVNNPPKMFEKAIELAEKDNA